MLKFWVALLTVSGGFFLAVFPDILIQASAFLQAVCFGILILFSIVGIIMELTRKPKI
jgi:membrane protein CcdC involved in cytochrome C biogenesis